MNDLSVTQASCLPRSSGAMNGNAVFTQLELLIGVERLDVLRAVQTAGKMLALLSAIMHTLQLSFYYQK